MQGTWKIFGTWMLAANMFSGCSSQVSIHPSTRAPQLNLDSKQASKIEKRLSQKTHAQHNVRLIATLWDSRLLDVEATKLRLGLAQQAAISEEEIRSQLERWRNHYLRDQTSFTVLLELRNRPGEKKSSDDLLIDPQGWNFSLSIDHRSSIRPHKVIVQAVDRYPNRNEGWHWRIALSVHFPGELYKEVQSRNTPLPVTLRVKLPRSSVPSPFLALDLPVGEIPLHWTVLPSTGPGSSHHNFAQR